MNRRSHLPFSSLSRDRLGAACGFQILGLESDQMVEWILELSAALRKSEHALWNVVLDWHRVESWNLVADVRYMLNLDYANLIQMVQPYKVSGREESRGVIKSSSKEVKDLKS
jgi:hypothetical protein